VFFFLSREAAVAHSHGRKPVVRSKKTFEPRSGGSKWRNDLTQATEYSLLSPLRGLPNSKKSFTAGLRPQLVRLQVCFVRKVKVLFKETRSGL
jgi:hypothetical protein